MVARVTSSRLLAAARSFKILAQVLVLPLRWRVEDDKAAVEKLRFAAAVEEEDDESAVEKLGSAGTVAIESSNRQG
ncbi:hypothetical protein ACFX13_009540 [Malus domestica]